MRFRTKIFLLSVLLAVLSSSMVVVLTYWPTRDLFIDLMKSNVLSVAATTAALVDTSAHDKIKVRADENTPAYDIVEAQLRHARDANQRRDLWVTYVYSMRPYAKDSKETEFIVDGDEDGPNKSHVGDIYKSENKKYHVRFNEYQAEFVSDQWGDWLSANAPIHSENSDSVSSIGVDVSVSDIVKRWEGLLWHCALALLIAVIAAYLIASIASNRLTKPLVTIRDTVDKITNGDYTQTLSIKSADEFGQLATSVNKMTLGLQQREDLKNALTRYVSADVLHDVIYAGKANNLFSNRKKVTILFADVRGFTTFSEQVSPEETVRLLNEYFEKMIAAIFKNHGHLNKFMGDGLMALFGALRDDEFQEEHAVQAALDMREALAKLQQKWSASDERVHSAFSNFRIGIGINTGLAIVGNIGSTQRMEFTAIGDSVNLASRLEHATRNYEDVDIIVSEYTFVAARSRFPFEPVGEIPIKGKSESVCTYTINT